MNERMLAGVLRQSRTIAVVGASAAHAEPAYFVPEYLQALGYQILPVHPTGGEILGEPVHRRLGDLDARVDIVSVFHVPGRAEAVVPEALTVGATVLWYQPGTATERARRLAREVGLLVVTDCCIGETHAELGVGPPRRAVTPPRPHCTGHRPYRPRKFAIG